MEIRLVLGFSLVIIMFACVATIILGGFWVFMMTKWPPILKFRRKYVLDEYDEITEETIAREKRYHRDRWQR